MKLKYKKPKGQRIKKQFLYITTNYDIWWSPELSKWIKPGSSGRNLELCSRVPCRSVKAFKRHIRNHPEIIRPSILKLVNRFIGYDVTG